jgi:hypothetical protein
MSPAAKDISTGTTNNTNNTNTKVVFAPPPPFPTSLQVLKSKLSNYQTTTKNIKSTLPPYHEIKHSGHALARFSAKSRLLTKKWRPTFWITQAQHKLVFFRSKVDFDEWAANPYLTTQERNKLVKVIYDFKNDAYKPGYKNLKGYRASPIQSKFVKLNHRQQQQEDQDAVRKMASHFSLECWTSSKGPSILVEIGGTDAGQVGALHIVLAEMIHLSGHEYTPPIAEHSHGGAGGRNTAAAAAAAASSSLSSHHSNHSRIHGNRSHSTSVWELHSAGSNSSAVGYYSISNMSSYASSIYSTDDSTGPQQQHEAEWNIHQGNHATQHYSARHGTPPKRLHSLGSRIMMRMRSRSPSTRAQRVQELQQEMLQQQKQQEEYHPHEHFHHTLMTGGGGTSNLNSNNAKTSWLHDAERRSPTPSPQH